MREQEFCLIKFKPGATNLLSDLLYLLRLLQLGGVLLHFL